MCRKPQNCHNMSETGVATGGSGDLFTSLSNVARLAAHSKFVWFSTPNMMSPCMYR
jgi:hypothetical protein